MEGWWELALEFQLMTLDDRWLSFSSIQLNLKVKLKTFGTWKSTMKNMARCSVQHFQQMNEETPDSFVVGFFLIVVQFSFSNRCKWTAGRICRLGVGTIEVQVTCPSCSIHGVAHVIDTDLGANSQKRGTACVGREQRSWATAKWQVFPHTLTHNTNDRTQNETTLTKYGKTLTISCIRWDENSVEIVEREVVVEATCTVGGLNPN